MIKVDFFGVEVKYSGRFDSYTKEDWKKMALMKCDSGVDAYEQTITCVSFQQAKWFIDHFDFKAVDRFPCNKLAYVKWAKIRVKEEG